MQLAFVPSFCFRMRLQQDYNCSICTSSSKCVQQFKINYFRSGIDAGKQSIISKNGREKTNKQCKQAKYVVRVTHLGLWRNISIILPDLSVAVFAVCSISLLNMTWKNKEEMYCWICVNFNPKPRGASINKYSISAPTFSNLFFEPLLRKYSTSTVGMQCFPLPVSSSKLYSF